MLRNNSIYRFDYLVCIETGVQPDGSRPRKGIRALDKREADMIATAYARAGYEAEIQKVRTYGQLVVNVLPAPK